MTRILDGVDAFLDQLAAIDVLPAFIAVLCQLARLFSTSQAWRNVLVAAYPDRLVPRRSIYAAYLSGIGINAIIPVRAGDAVRVVLAHRAIKDSTYTTVISSTLVLSIFDIAAASALLIWAAVTLDELPGIGELPNLRSFDFAWLLDRPLAAELILAGILIALAILAVWIHGHVVDFWDRVKQAFAVVRDPPAYFGSVVIWQAADWSLRLVTVWFMLDAFDIPQSIQNVLLVQVSSSLATLLPAHPRRSRHRAGVPALRLRRRRAGRAAARVQRRHAADPPGDEHRRRLHRDRAHAPDVQLPRSDEEREGRTAPP